MNLTTNNNGRQSFKEMHDFAQHLKVGYGLFRVHEYAEIYVPSTVLGANVIDEWAFHQNMLLALNGSRITLAKAFFCGYTSPSAGLDPQTVTREAKSREDYAQVVIQARSCIIDWVEG